MCSVYKFVGVSTCVFNGKGKEERRRKGKEKGERKKGKKRRRRERGEGEGKGQTWTVHGLESVVVFCMLVVVSMVAV